MRSPEVSPSSLDAVIAPVICWQKRGTEKIWRLGKTSPPSWRCGRVVIAFCNSWQEQSCVSDTGAHAANGGSNPPISTIGVTSCLAAARSVSLRKWSFLCAVRKRRDEVIYILAGTGFVMMNGCDRRTGAGLKSSVVGLGAGVCGETPRRKSQIWTRRGGGCPWTRPPCRSVSVAPVPRQLCLHKICSVSVQRSAHQPSKLGVAVQIRYAAPCPPDG